MEKLSVATLETLNEIISGGTDHDPFSDEGRIAPYRSPIDVAKFFYKFGCNQYEWTHIKNYGRYPFIKDRLKEANGTSKIFDIIKAALEPKRFSSGDINFEKTLEEFNKYLRQDGYEVIITNTVPEIIGRKNNVLPDVIKVSFEDIRNDILTEIKKAKFLVWAAIAWFTDQQMFKALVDKKNEGVNVQLIIFDTPTNEKSGIKYSEIETYKNKPNNEGRDQIMHHKFCIIDLQIVITGCYNWSYNAQYNKEDIVTIKLPEIAEKYAEQFKKLKIEGRRI